MHWPIFALMAIIQIAGVFAATHYYMRMRAVTVPAKYLWLFLTSLIGGAAGFTAHYLTIATVSPGDHLFLDPIFVTISGLIALSSIGLAFLFSFRFQPPASALSFALACHPMISAGNLATLLTAEVQGTLAYSTPHILLGLAVSFVVALVGSWCVERAQRFSRVILGTLALGCMTPFQVIVFLKGARITPDLAGPLPAGLTTDTTLVAVLSMATLVILLVGGAGLLIERRLENMAKVRYRQLAMTDPMTGLLNRIGLKDELSGHEFEAGHAHALFAIDLDRFKPINDLHGHEAGDVVLATLSRRLKETLSSHALTARTGGDEFIAIVDIGSGDASEAAARAIAATLLETFGDPVMFGEKSLTVGASIGIALQPRDAETLADLQLAADIALYTAKKQRGTAIFYEAEMGEDVRKRTELATEMRRAIEQDEFVLHFQKQMHLGTRRISGFEALIRWQHPARGLLAPIEFIPIAEESDLISDIGRWVLNRACKVAATWPKPHPVAVNVAARQLAMPEFVEEVEDALLQSGLPAHRLEIELTEASVIEDREQALDVMIRLRKLGVRLAMDDYGTGYASLAALQTFPFDKLKIDRSFIDGVSTNPQSKAIVRSTLLLTSALSVPVVAEGVETEEHIAFLTSEGCEDVQGFYFGQPMPERDVLSVIVAERARDAVDRACAEKA